MKVCEFPRVNVRVPPALVSGGWRGDYNSWTHGRLFRNDLIVKYIG